MLRVQVEVLTRMAAVRRWLIERVDPASERGDVSSTTIMIAVLAALAIAVGAIITAKVTEKANAIPTD